MSTVKINHIQESILSEAAAAIFRELEQFCGERLYVNMEIDDIKPQWMIVICPIPPEEDDYFNAIKVVISANKDVLPHMIEDDWLEGIKGLINDHLSPEKVESFLIKRSLVNPMPEEIWYEGCRKCTHPTVQTTRSVIPMKDRLEKLQNLKGKIQDRIDEVDDLLLQTTLYDSLLDERIRLHKVLDDVYTDIQIVEYSNLDPERKSP